MRLVNMLDANLMWLTIVINRINALSVLITTDVYDVLVWRGQSDRTFSSNSTYVTPRMVVQTSTNEHYWTIWGWKGP